MMLWTRTGNNRKEKENDEGLQTSELGEYKVDGGMVFINGVMAEPKAEDRKLTLTEGKTTMILNRQ